MSTLKELIEVGAHFGHKTSRWSPKMGDYVWGTRNKVHLIDVRKTVVMLEHACACLEKATTTGGKALWVGTKKAAQEPVRRIHEKLNMPSVSHRWIGGSLTNFEQVKKAVTRLLHLRDILDKPLTTLKKKEIVSLRKEEGRLTKNIGGIIDLSFPPAVLIVVDARKEATAIKEANCIGIPVIGIVDTDTDPTGIDIVIPSNDDSPRAISFLLGKLSDAAEKGQKVYLAKKAEEDAKRAAARQEAAALKKAAADKRAAEAKKNAPAQKAAATKPAPKKTEPKKAATKPAAVKEVAKPATKPAATKKATAPKAPAKAVTKPVDKKTVVAKEVVKPAAKAAPKKVAAKPAAKKTTTAKKPAAKTTTTTVEKKSAAKKTVATKKPAAKAKTPAKKAEPKKTAAKPAAKKTVTKKVTPKK